jgi:hypothetical protein
MQFIPPNRLQSYPFFTKTDGGGPRPQDFSPMLIKIAGGDPLVYTFFYKKCKGGGLRNPRPQDVSTMNEGSAIETPRRQSIAHSDWTSVH